MSTQDFLALVDGDKQWQYQKEKIILNRQQTMGKELPAIK
jgi:hypothetical protein